MNRPISFTIVAYLATLIAPCQAADPQSATKPNILFILVDDLSWADLACQGHAWHQTPHTDRLAREGMRFTSAYAPAPICSASRASILTGKTTARLNFEFVTKNKAGRQQLDAATPLQAPPFTLDLPLKETTIAECLSRADYDTAFFGKWHLNSHYQRYLGWSPTHGPPQQGFAVAVEDFGGHPYAWGKRVPKVIEEVGSFPHDTMIERACKYIGREHERPYFLMVSQFYVHTPVKTRCQWLLEKYDQLVPAGAPNRERRIRYAAFVEALDHHVGELLAAIEASGQREQTLVVLTSDNGGHPEYTANGPLRGSKWNLYEGGIRVPLLARWPNKIKAGSTCDTPVIGYDLLPTFAAVAGAKPSEVDGVDISSLLKGGEPETDRDLIWHFPYYHPETGFAAAQEGIGVDDFAVSRTRPQSAIRRGRYKLLLFQEQDRVELYDLANDLSEQHDLSQQKPAIAEDLNSSLKRQLRKMNARFATPVP